MTAGRDLFGNPIPEKKGRRRRPEGSTARPRGPRRGAEQLPLAPPGPALSDLVARLKPLHRRLETDLTQTLKGDLALQRQVEAVCEDLSRQMGVAVGVRQYVHTAATIYVLKALFLRVAEDHGLFPPQARKVALRGALFASLRNLAPRLTWADYLEYAVRELAYLPVAYDLFKETGYEWIPLSEEMARALLDTVADLPDLRDMDTRALGDLYEHLMDEQERKRLGYYTTPDFIIDFLLERTLEPAVQEFGVYELRYLDPACGTGHFLVRAYRRLDAHLAREDAHLSPLERFERIVETNLFGIDISEFATRITLFRLFLEGVRLAQREGVDLAQWGRDITFNIYTANSLIRLPEERDHTLAMFPADQPPHREKDPAARWYGRELTHLRVDLRDALRKGFHVVNANPPYVRIHRQEAEVLAPMNGGWERVDFVRYLRDNYETAYSQFDLSVPFVERGLELLVRGGFLGYITSGKFAKQAYGSKLAALLAGGKYRLLFFGDLTDATVFQAGSYPALIVLRRPGDDAPVSAEAPVEVLATYQPAGRTTEENWDALRRLLAQEGDRFEAHAGHYRERQGHFRGHPWTLRRGEQDLLAKIQAVSDRTLADYVERIGEDFQSNADPVFCDYITESFIRRNRLERDLCIPCLRGENIRNWTVTWHGNRKREQTYVLYTHDKETGEPIPDLAERYPHAFRYLLRYKEYLWARAAWGRQTYRDAGIPFYRLHQTSARLGVPKIVFPRIATHAHFFLSLDGKVLAKDSCEVLYFRGDEARHVQLALFLALNSAVGNYFMKQAGHKLFEGATERKARYEWARKHIGRFPIPKDLHKVGEALEELAQRILGEATEIMELSPYRLLRGDSPQRLHDRLEEALVGTQSRLRRLQELQVELDALVAQAYGLEAQDLKELKHPTFQRPWPSEKMVEKAFWEDALFQIRDYLCDLVEEVFAAQPPQHERPLTPAEIAEALAQNPKVEPLRAVYYGGRPISREEFVRECMDWDCRPIPFDEEKVLVSRRPKRVDVLHERFFRFDGVSRDLYGWTGWSPEAQANVFLTLAKRAADRTPFYRWVARLISLPEEAPDIEDEEVRRGLRRIIGDVEPYPYVVME